MYFSYMRGKSLARKIALGLISAYLLVWFTDSIWEYIPELKPSITTPVVATPSPSQSPKCQTYWNAAGDAESNCEPIDVENPGWEGR